MSVRRESVLRADLPTFCLFKNLRIRADRVTVQPGDPLVGWEWYRSADDFADLVVPAPPLPVSLRKRGSDLNLLESVRLNELLLTRSRFNTTLTEFDRGESDQPSDLDLFGQRYTILFVCPPNVSSVVDFLISKRVSGKRTINFNEYLTRMWFYPETESGTSLKHQITTILEAL